MKDSIKIKLLKAYAFLKVLNLAYKGLQENSEHNQFYGLIEKELDYYKEMGGLNQSVSTELNESIRQVFPSGGVKLIKNYTKYQDAQQFTAKMKNISNFYMDLNALDNNGTLRKFADSLESLDNEIKNEIKDRVINLKKKKRNKQGTINTDIASIQPKKFKDYYLQLMNED